MWATMPIKEATFWFGITLFGTGLYFVFDSEGSKMIWAILLSGIGLVIVAYSVYEYHFPGGARKLPLWIIMLAATWLFFGYDYYDRHNQRFQEFVEPQEVTFLEYGQITTTSFFFRFL
jgi:hypothetical protein